MAWYRYSGFASSFVDPDIRIRFDVDKSSGDETGPWTKLDSIDVTVPNADPDGNTFTISTLIHKIRELAEPIVDKDRLVNDVIPSVEGALEGQVFQQ